MSVKNLCASACSGILLMLMLVAGCSGAPSGGDGGNNNGSNDMTTEPAPAPGSGQTGDLSGLFASDEAWVIGARQMILFGYGSQAEFIVGTASETGDPVCVGNKLDGNLSFDNGALDIDLSYSDGQIDKACRVSFSATVPQCSGTGVCRFSDALGTMRVGDTSMPLEGVGLTRLASCVQTPLLDGRYAWSIFNIHPLLSFSLNDPGTFGQPLIGIVGQNGVTQDAFVISRIGAGGTPEGCFDANPTGPVNFDGNTLSVDMAIEGRDNNAGAGLEGTCDVTFTGRAAYCAELGPNTFGNNFGGGTTGFIVRLEGSGGLTGPAGSDSLDALYLVFGSANAGAVPGGVRLRAR